MAGVRAAVARARRHAVARDAPHAELRARHVPGEFHQCETLFGIDAGPDLDTYQIYARFLETVDEYFDYGSDVVPGQGRRRIYGLGLTHDVLDKIYFENANRLLLGQAK